jgi:hypothetical protein
MMGNALDLYLATQRVLAVAWPRRFGGRPVGGEPRPRIDDVIGAIEKDLPSWVRREVDEDRIRRCLAREFDVGGWPFAMLDEPTSG